MEEDPREHWTRVRDEAARMIAEVPLYQGRPAPPAGDDPAAIAAWFTALQTVTKRDFRRGFPKGLVRAGSDLKAALESGAVEILSTSGTGGERTQVIRDPVWWRQQEDYALGSWESPLRHATIVPPAKGTACHSGNLSRAERERDGVLTLNQLADPAFLTDGEIDRILDEWREFAPPFVTANPSYLAPIARRAAATGRPVETDLVVLADELVTRAQRRAIAAGVRMSGAPDAAAPCWDLYRTVEAGTIFVGWFSGHLHAPPRVHVDLVPIGAGLARIVVTSLVDRRWGPLLRYDTGDLARLLDGECKCEIIPCGLPIARVEGRVADSLEANSGLITPAMLDNAVDRDGLDAWQLLDTPGGAELIAVGTDAARAAAAAAASSLLGRPVRLRPDAIVPEASGKFRLIKKVEP